MRDSPWPSLRASPQQYDLYGLKHDPEVQTDRGILDIEQVVLQFLARVVQRITVLILHLSPAGDAGPHGVAHPVIGNFPAQPLHEFGTLRSGSDKMHIAFED